MKPVAGMHSDYRDSERTDIGKARSGAQVGTHVLDGDYRVTFVLRVEAGAGRERAVVGYDPAAADLAVEQRLSSTIDSHSLAWSVPWPELTTEVPAPPSLGSRQHRFGLTFSHSGAGVPGALAVAAYAAAPFSTRKGASANAATAGRSADRLIDYTLSLMRDLRSFIIGSRLRRRPRKLTGSLTGRTAGQSLVNRRSISYGQHFPGVLTLLAMWLSRVLLK